MASNTDMHKLLNLICSIKKHVPWVLLSVIVPVAVFVLFGGESEFKEKPTDLPPLVAETVMFTGFIVPPEGCYKFHRWPNTIEYCDYRVNNAGDMDVTKFYDAEFIRRGWVRRNVDTEGWKTPTDRSLVLSFYSRDGNHFILEKPIKQGGLAEDNVYRLLFTTMLTTKRDK